MDDLIKNIKKDICQMEKVYAESSKMDKEILSYEFGSLLSLMEIVDINKEIKYDAVLANKIINNVASKIKKYIFDFLELADTVINMFKEANFVYYKSYGNIELSAQDKKDLLREFLEYYLKEAYDIYCHLFDQKRIFISDDNVAGESFVFNYIDSFYLTISNKCPNDLCEVETIIHELIHIYASKYLYKRNHRLLKNYYMSYYYEAATLYSELSFYDFLIRKGFDKKEVNLYRNIGDRYLLHFFQTIKYIGEAVKDDDVTIVLGDIYYEITSQNPLIIPDKNPLYELDDKFMSGSINDFTYAVSSLDAARLVNKEREGILTPKEILNEYLLTFTDREKLEKELYYLDIEDFSKDIKSRIKR